MKYDEYTLNLEQAIASRRYVTGTSSIGRSEVLKIALHKYCGVLCYYRLRTYPDGATSETTEKAEWIKSGKGGVCVTNLAIEIDIVEKDNCGWPIKAIVRVPRNGKKTLRNLKYETA